MFNVLSINYGDLLWSGSAQFFYDIIFDAWLYRVVL